MLEMIYSWICRGPKTFSTIYDTWRSPNMLSKRHYTLYIPFLGSMDATKLSQPSGFIGKALPFTYAPETK